MKDTFVVETDEEGFVRSLVGPFTWKDAHKDAKKKEAVYEGDLQEPFTVIRATTPK
jgi:hypothetical protein